MSSALVKLTSVDAPLVPKDLPMEPWMYGALALTILLVLLLTAYAFRSVWTRH